MNPILIVLPFHNGDLELAKRLLGWMAELKVNNKPHSLLVAYDASVPADALKEIGALARACNFAHLVSVSIRVEAKGWPKAPNQMFGNVAGYIHKTFRFPFLWVEPDATPLRPDWIDRIASAYDQCPTRYMGPLVKCTDPALPPLHLTGCAVYPNNAVNDLGELCKTTEQAWDVASADLIVKTGKAQHTDLMHHLWGEPNLPPTYVLERVGDSPLNAVEVSKIPEQAVLAHRVKDSSLINCLKKLKSKNATIPKKDRVLQGIPEKEPVANQRT